MIRDLMAADLPQLQQLWMDSLGVSAPEVPCAYWRRRMPAAICRGPLARRCVLVYLAPGQCHVEGFVALRDDGLLEALLVAPEARGLGAGSQLMQQVKQRQSQLDIWVLEDNLSGRYFLQQHGFVEQERLECAEAGQAEILMRYGAGS